MKHKIIALVSLMLLLPVLSLATTLRVPSQYSSILGAINAAVDGDTILVAPGLYEICHGYNLYKALHIISEAGPEATIIDNKECCSVSCPEMVSWGFKIRNLSGPFTLSGFTMKHFYAEWPDLSFGGYAIDIENADGMISNNIFYESMNYYAINIEGDSRVKVEQNLFYSNAGAIRINTSALATVRFNTIVNNSFIAQIYITGDECSSSIFCNIVVNSTCIGIYSDAPYEKTSIRCNDVWNNSIGEYGGVLPDLIGYNGNISQDPLFCGIPGSGNYYLQSGSPCAESNVPGICVGLRMGVYPVYCDVGTKETSWSKIKSLYKN